MLVYAILADVCPELGAIIPELRSEALLPLLDGCPAEATNPPTGDLNRLGNILKKLQTLTEDLVLLLTDGADDADLLSTLILGTPPVELDIGSLMLAEILLADTTPMFPADFSPLL